MSVGPGVPDDDLDAARARPADSVAFFRSQSQRSDIPDRELEQIAEALGQHRQALALAARLLAERPSASAEIYLEALSEHAASAPEAAAYPSVYRAAVLTSFEIVEHEPAMQGQSATSLLAFAAFLPRNEIAAAMLKGTPEDYPEEIRPFIADNALRGEALTLLGRLGLIENNLSGQSFAVPELTAAVVRDLLEEAGETATWQRASAAAAQRVEHPQARKTLEAPYPQDIPKPPPPTASREQAIALFEAAEGLAASGRFAEALASHDYARAEFEHLVDAAPDDTQAQADLAASHAKIGLTQASAGHPREGLVWLQSCRRLIADLAAREPGSELWPRYLASLDGQIVEMGAGVAAPPMARAANGVDRGTVHRLVNALKQPEQPGLDMQADGDTLAMPLGAVDDEEEPAPLELSGAREPPKVFTSESLFAEEAGLAPPAEAAQPRRAGFFARLLGRRD